MSLGPRGVRVTRTPKGESASPIALATAAWAPDVVFALAGTYLFLRMKS